ncbi:MAG: ATP-binding protein, partial [Gammaproteobacteria bacterium]
MIRAIAASLRDWARLLYWVFFKPKALRAHVREIAPVEAAERGSLGEFLRVCTTHPALRGFLMKALVYTTFTALLLMALVALISVAFGGEFDLQRALANLALGVAGGMAVGMAFGVAGSVAFSVAFGVAFGVAGGVAGGVAFGVAFDVAAGMAFGVAFGVAFG